LNACSKTESSFTLIAGFVKKILHALVKIHVLKNQGKYEIKDAARLADFSENGCRHRAKPLTDKNTT
jgi:hypothetical protein